MTLVKIDIRGVASSTHTDDKVVFWSPAVRKNTNGTLVSTAEEVVELVNGVGEVNLTPGPVFVLFQCRGVSDTSPKQGTVPDSETVTVGDVIAGSFTYTPEITSSSVQQIRAAQSQALTAITQALNGALATVQSSVATEIGTKLDTKADKTTVEQLSMQVMATMGMAGSALARTKTTT